MLHATRSPRPTATESRASCPAAPGCTVASPATTASFFDAVLYVARTGTLLAELPARFDNWNSIWRRFDH